METQTGQTPEVQPTPVGVGSGTWFGAVSVVLVKGLPDGGTNIMNQISQIETVCEDAAVGAAVTRAMKDFPGYQVHCVTKTRIEMPNTPVRDGEDRASSKLST